jgi:hypothetical protein
MSHKLALFHHIFFLFWPWCYLYLFALKIGDAGQYTLTMLTRYQYRLGFSSCFLLHPCLKSNHMMLLFYVAALLSHFQRYPISVYTRCLTRLKLIADLDGDSASTPSLGRRVWTECLFFFDDNAGALSLRTSWAFFCNTFARLGAVSVSV